MDRHRQSAAKIKHSAREVTPPNISQQMIHSNLKENLPALQNAENGNDADSGTLRRSIVIDVDSLLGHALVFVGDGDGNSVDAIQSMHERLIFDAENNGGNVTEGEMKLSTPPGLRNLGATCYVNSQLQCLAQNLGFAHGLFSWRKPPFDTGSEVEKRMATVLSHMQNILARMRYGPDRVIGTNEFASALSLENDEMQDPNEVSQRASFAVCLDSPFTPDFFIASPSSSLLACSSIECRNRSDNRPPSRPNRYKADLANCCHQCLAALSRMLQNALSAAKSRSERKTLWI